MSENAIKSAIKTGSLLIILLTVCSAAGLAAKKETSALKAKSKTEVKKLPAHYELPEHYELEGERMELVDSYVETDDSDESISNFKLMDPAKPIPSPHYPKALAAKTEKAERELIAKGEDDSIMSDKMLTEPGMNPLLSMIESLMSQTQEAGENSNPVKAAENAASQKLLFANALQEAKMVQGKANQRQQELEDEIRRMEQG